MPTLNDKQRRFVEEYLVDANATQAAIRAGYSEASAYSQAHDLLKKPDVQAAIQAGRARLSERTGITAERVLAEIARIGFSDLRKAVRWGSTVAVPWGHKDAELDENGSPFKAHTPIALVDSSEIDDDTAAAIAEVRQTKEGLAIKLHDKLGALDKLAKHLGLYAPEKHEHTGKDGAAIAVDLTPNDRARRIAFALAKAARAVPAKD